MNRFATKMRLRSITQKHDSNTPLVPLLMTLLSACAGPKYDNTPYCDVSFLDEPGDCMVYECDVSGNVIQVPDPSDVPTDEPGDCMIDTCSASGTITKRPDPSDLPADDVNGDCRRPTCDGTSYMPDPNDPAPDPIPHDCMVNVCDENGATITVPGDDRPDSNVCVDYTCAATGTLVTTPIHEGETCSNMGYSCSSAGKCSECPGPDETCSEVGPGVGAQSIASAFEFGAVGFCDYNGGTFCGRLAADTTEHFQYYADGSFSFCIFDPYVKVWASEPVTLCEYFKDATISCPSGTTFSLLDGHSGCCTTGAAPSMALEPSVAGRAFFTIKPVGSSCVSYEAYFHT